MKKTSSKVSRPVTKNSPAITIAIEHHQAGRLAEAEASYRKILAADPDNFEALHRSGILAYQAGNHAQAIEFFRKAVSRNPTDCFAHNNLGFALHAQGKLDEAVASYQKALALKPDHLAAYFNLGGALHALERWDQAVACYRKALTVKPDSAEACYNLGGALQASGNSDEAVACYRKALMLKPDYAEASNNLGQTLYTQRKWDEAAACYRQAIAGKPDYAEAVNNLGRTLDAQDKRDEAAACYRQAIALKPDYAEARYNLGGVLHAQGKRDEAVACYRQTIALKPNYAEAHFNLGATFHAQHKWDDAIACYRQALALKPDYAEAHYNFGITLHAQRKWSEAISCYRQALAIKPDYAEVHCNLGATLTEQDKWDEAVSCYRQALALKPDYADAYYNLGVALNALGKRTEAIDCYERALALDPDHPSAHSNLVMAMLYEPGYSASELLAAHVRFGNRVEAQLKPSWPAHPNSRDPHRRLKVGYVSGDFRQHAVAYFFEPLLAGHDKAEVEVFCYFNDTRHDSFTDRLVSLADHWVPCLHMSEDQLAERIRNDGIDILVDLSGHSSHNRLLTFARKPAPIQVTYLGYPASSGLSAMDYRLTDSYADPQANDSYYREKLLRLPNSLWCYRPAADMPDVTPLPALTNGFLTFGSFNNINKIGDQCIKLWAALLRTLPSSRLLMVTVPEGEMRQRLVQQFTDFGVMPERLDFRGRLAPHEFQRTLRQVDMTLDPFPINGATTTCESLWLGVPVISLVGDRFYSRAGLSVMNAAGLPDFVAATPEDYLKIPALLAENFQLLAGIRAGLREHLAASPLIDNTGFARNVEKIYREIWAEWCGCAP
jgi:protein O-GlcNAc transferase